MFGNSSLRYYDGRPEAALLLRAIEFLDADTIRNLMTHDNFSTYFESIKPDVIFHRRVIKFLLKCEIGPKIIIENFPDLLHRAVAKKDPKFVSFLLRVGFDPNFEIRTWGTEWSPLAVAMQARSYRCITPLVNGGANVNASGLLLRAVSRCDKFMTERLLELGAIPDLDSFISAMRHGTGWMKRLLRTTKIISVNVKEFEKFMLKFFKSPMWAETRRFMYSLNCESIDLYTTDLEGRGIYFHRNRMKILLYVRRERMRILEALRLTEPISSEDIKVIEEKIEKISPEFSGPLMKKSLYYALGNSLLALLYFKSIGIPRDIRRMIILLSFR